MRLAPFNSTSGKPRWLPLAMLPLAIAEPLHLAAHNLHRIPSPIKLVSFAVVVWILGTAVINLTLRYLVPDPYVAVASGWVVTLSLLKWRIWSQSHILLWVVVAAVALATVYRLRHSGLVGGIFFVAAVVIAGPPMMQLAGAVFGAEPIRMPQYTAELDVGRPADAVEDVVIVIFDGLPSPNAVRHFFDHDPAPTVDALSDAGYSVPDQAWSTVTATSGAIPGILSLGTLDLVGTVPDVRALARIAGGANPTIASLTGAGFRYTHIEAGWGQSLCHDKVDECIRAPFWDRPTWGLLEPTPLGGWLEREYGSPYAYSGRRVVEVLEQQGSQRLDDGERDVIFAHVMVPHVPFVLGSDCQPSDTPLGHFPLPDTNDPDLGPVQAQFACAFRWVERVAEVAGEKTAMVITSDHGSRIHYQMDRHPAEWTDIEAAERLSVFLAYRFPEGCGQPEVEVNAEAMRAMIECMFGTKLDLPAPRYQLFVTEIDGVRPLVKEVARSHLQAPGASARVASEN